MKLLRSTQNTHDNIFCSSSRRISLQNTNKKNYRFLYFIYRKTIIITGIIYSVAFYVVRYYLIYKINDESKNSNIHYKRKKKSFNDFFSTFFSVDFEFLVFSIKKNILGY